MSILTDKLPETLEIKGKICSIKTDFRVWLRFTELISEGENIKPSDVAEIFRLIFEELPPNFFDAISEVMKFYTCGERKASKEKTGNASKRIYDFEADAELIYSAFLQQYRIDLTTENLHWHKFKALFNSLSEDTQFIKIVQFRTIKLSEIKDKEQRKYYKKMKELYRLPDNRTEEEKENALNNEISRIFEG